MSLFGMINFRMIKNFEKKLNWKKSFWNNQKLWKEIRRKLFCVIFFATSLNWKNSFWIDPKLWQKTLKKKFFCFFEKTPIEKKIHSNKFDNHTGTIPAK